MTVVATALLWILGVVAVALVALLVLLVLVPLHVEARGALDDARAEGRAQVRWGLWLLALRADTATGIDLRVLGLRIWRFRPGRTSPRAAARREKRRAASAKKKNEKKRRIRRRDALLAGLRVAATIAHAIPVRGHLIGTLGLSDPADTAALFAVIDRLAARMHAIEIDVMPDWIDETLALEGAVRARLWPARILAALVWLLLRHRPTRRRVFAMLRTS